MLAKELMTRDPVCVTPDDSAQQAATLMAEHDCGVLPVVEDNGSRRIVGVVTDRDIAIRGVAQGRGADMSVRDVMTTDPECCSSDADIHEVERVMESRQVRRVPIIDAAGQLVGIIAQADLALEHTEVSDEEVGRVVERISEPGRRMRPAAAD